MSDLTAIRERHRPVRYGKSAQCAEDDAPWPCDTAQVLATLDAAERERDALRAAPIDVERLARALRRTDMTRWEAQEGAADDIAQAAAGGPDFTPKGDDSPDWLERETARIIAAEYAALAASPDIGPETEEGRP